MKRDLLTILDLTSGEIEKIFRRASLLKKERKRGRLNFSLKGKTLAMIFEKSSTRTRVSFDVAMTEMGGRAINLEGSSTQLGRGETYADTARVLSLYTHGIMVRTFAHQAAEDLAEAASVPVINGLTDLHHPCQLLADLLTVRENKKRGKVCYIGDGNNMANSWIEAALLLKFPLVVATPPGFEPSPKVTEKLTPDNSIVITHDPVEAARGADVVNTDTWFSMGQTVEEAKKKAFQGYQVNERLLKMANPEAIVLHCLPAHRGEEITAEVIDGPQSRVWQQAENRLHVQKAILEMLLK